MDPQPKEKAKEIFDLYNNTNNNLNFDLPFYQVQHCAIIAVNHIIKVLKELYDEEYYRFDDYKYWEEVKKEIENL